MQFRPENATPSLRITLETSSLQRNYHQTRQLDSFMLLSRNLSEKKTKRSVRTTAAKSTISTLLSGIPIIGPYSTFERFSPLSVCAIIGFRLCYTMFSITIFFLSLVIDWARQDRGGRPSAPSAVQERIDTVEKSIRSNRTMLESGVSSSNILAKRGKATDSAIDLSEKDATEGRATLVDKSTHTDPDYEKSTPQLRVSTDNLGIRPDTPIPPDSAVSLDPGKFETEVLIPSATDQSPPVPSGPPPPPPPPPPLPGFKRPRCLNWTPISCVTGSVFDIREGKVVLCESVKESVRREFTPDDSIKKKKNSLASISPPGCRTSILTNDRSRNIEIVLRRTTIENVIYALMAMDTKALPSSVCSQLKAVLHPQAYEIEGAQRMAGFSSDQIDRLPRSDRYIVKLLRVPNYTQRMSDFVFLTHVTEILHEMQNIQRQAAHCTQYLLNNPDVQLVFDTILAIGNVLNENTPLAQARGFRLDVLPSLKHKRTADGRNFNHTLCEVMKTQFGGFGAALAETKSLCSLKNVSDTQIAEMDRQLTAIAARGPGYGNDRFKEYLRASKELLDNIMHSQKHIHALQKRLCKFFIADESNEIYSTIGNYLSELAALV